MSFGDVSLGVWPLPVPGGPSVRKPGLARGTDDCGWEASIVGMLRDPFWAQVGFDQDGAPRVIVTDVGFSRYPQSRHCLTVVVDEDDPAVVARDTGVDDAVA